MIITYTALDGSSQRVDTTDRIDFVLDRDERSGRASCTVNGVAVTEEVYESVMAQLRVWLG